MSRGPDYFNSGEAHRRDPDYFKDANKPKKADWKRHERDISRRSGDRQVAGSGNKPGRPGDTMGARFIREGKSTKHASISISQEWMRKLIEQALRMGKVPLFEIRLEAAQVPVPTDWILLPADDFQELLDGVKVVRPGG